MKKKKKKTFTGAKTLKPARTKPPFENIYRTAEAFSASEEIFHLLNTASSDLLKLTDLQSVYSYIVTYLREHVPDSVILYVSINEKEKVTRLENLAGLNSTLLKKIVKITGFNPLGKTFKLTKAHDSYFREGRLMGFEKGLADFAGPEFPSLAARSIEKLLGLKKIYTIGIKEGDSLLAAIHFFVFNQKIVPDFAFIDALVSQTGLILQKKMAELELQESEEKYRSLVENANSIIIKWDSSGRITYFNEFAEKFFGFKKEEILGSSVIDTIVPPAESSGRDLKEMMRRIQKDPDQFMVNENENTTKEGKRVWVRWNNKADKDAKGKIIGILSVGIDITERMLAEQTNLVHNHLAMALGTATDIEASLNQVLDIMMELKGVDSGGIYVSRMDSGDIELICHRGVAASFIKKVSNYSSETPQVKLLKEGKSSYMSISSMDKKLRNPIFKTEGLKMIAIIPIIFQGQLLAAMNLSSHHAEEFPQETREIMESAARLIAGFLSRLNTEQALLESENRFRSLIENSADVITLLDSNGKVIYDSPSYRNLLGYAPEDRLGKSILELIHPDDQGTTLELFERLLKTPAQAKILPTRVLRKDGNWIWIEGVANNLLADKGVRAIVINYRNISERLKAEQELRDSEARFKNVLQNTFIALYKRNFLLDRYDYMSPAIKGIFGYTVEEMIQMPVKQVASLIHPEDLEAVNRKIGEIVAGGGGLVLLEYRAKHKNGKYVWVQDMVSYTVNDRHEPVYSIGSLQDITMRKNADDALREYSQRLDLAITSGKLGVWDWNVTDNVMVWSDRMFELYGITREAFPNTVDAWTNGLHPDDKERAIAESNMALAGQKEFNTTFRVKHPDGTVKHLKANAIIIKSKDGKSVRMIGINSDITEQKTAEKALWESELRQRRYLEHSPYGVFAVDSAGHYIEVNPAATRITGYSKEELLTMSIVDLLLPDRVEEGLSLFRKLIESGNVYGEIPFRHKNGETRWWSIAGVKINGSRFLGFCDDITERKHDKQELVDLNRTLGDKVSKAVSEIREKDQMMILQSRQAALGEMLGNIAHQWRQPLNAIGILVQNLLEYDKAGALDRAYLEKNVGKTMDLITHMSRTIDDFRNFFKPNKEKTGFGFKAAIENALSFVSASMKDNEINVSIHCDCEKEIEVSGYPNEFSQVLLNIFNNALDAVKERHTKDPELLVHIFQENGRSVITVTDNAGGIPNDILQKIFEPFFTTKEMGTGIGLYMAKNIIEKSMGGKLTARNIKNGVEFRIEI